MNIKVHPEVLKLLGDVDIENTVNDIVYVYLSDGFLRLADVKLRMVVDTIYRKRADHLRPVFDSITQQFVGVGVMGKTDSETLWIASPKLHDALEENTELIVLKTPRESGIRLKSGKDIMVDPVPKDLFS